MAKLFKINSFHFVLIFILTLVMVNQNINGETDELTDFKLEALKKVKPDNTWSPLVLDKFFRIKYDANESFLSTPACIKVHNDNIYIVDNIRHCIKIYSIKGDFIRTLGQRGKGPSDLVLPIWCEFYNDKLFVKSENGIDSFDKNLKFEKRINFVERMKQFIVKNDYIYFGSGKVYNNQYPLFFKIDFNGNITKAILNNDMDDMFLKRVKNDIYILFIDNQFVVVPMHWNKLYYYDKNLDLIKTQKIDYPVLDKIQEWNQSCEINNKLKSNRIWPCNIIASAKVFNGKIYLLLGFPHLEILVLNPQGKIISHLFNKTDFKKMLWIDFDIRIEQGKTVFYLISWDISEEKSEEEDNQFVYRVISNK